MSHDALFQLGMGSVLLNASQTEETFVARTLNQRAEAIARDSLSRRALLCAPANGFRWRIMRRGNSAKALALREATRILRPVA